MVSSYSKFKAFFFSAQGRAWLFCFFCFILVLSFLVIRNYLILRMQFEIITLEDVLAVNQITIDSIEKKILAKFNCLEVERQRVANSEVKPSLNIFDSQYAVYAHAIRWGVRGTRYYRLYMNIISKNK